MNDPSSSPLSVTYVDRVWITGELLALCCGPSLGCLGLDISQTKACPNKINVFALFFSEQKLFPWSNTVACGINMFEGKEEKKKCLSKTLQQTHPCIILCPQIYFVYLKNCCACRSLHSRERDDSPKIFYLLIFFLFLQSCQSDTMRPAEE